jgi:hypothetical protein
MPSLRSSNTKHLAANEAAFLTPGPENTAFRVGYSCPEAKFLIRSPPEELGNMHHRSIAILAILCFACGGAGCESTGNAKHKSSKKKKHYQEVVMPLQTGSTLQRRTYLEVGPEPESKKKSKKKEAAAPKPDADPAETPPPPEEESTPPPDRFR